MTAPKFKPGDKVRRIDSVDTAFDLVVSEYSDIGDHEVVRCSIVKDGYQVGSTAVHVNRLELVEPAGFQVGDRIRRRNGDGKSIPFVVRTDDVDRLGRIIAEDCVGNFAILNPRNFELADDPIEVVAPKSGFVTAVTFHYSDGSDVRADVTL